MNSILTVVITSINIHQSTVGTTKNIKIQGCKECFMRKKEFVKRDRSPIEHVYGSRTNR